MSKDYQREVEKVFTYPTYYYQAFRLLDSDLLTPAEQRQELSRLLTVARKRQKRLRASKFSESYAARVELPRMKDLKTVRDVSQALAETALFIRSRRSTISGAEAYQSEVREALAETFAEYPEVDFNDPGFNWTAFGRYMQEMKKKGLAHEGAESEHAVHMYFIARGTGLTTRGLIDNYQEFSARQDELTSLYYNNSFGRGNTSGQAMMERLDSLRR